MRRLAGVLDELQAIVEYPEGHWAKVVKEFKLANGALRQKKDQLISLVRKLDVVNCWLYYCAVG